jgi:hypothetical protein
MRIKKDRFLFDNPKGIEDSYFVIFISKEWQQR